jgi:hypothetical protein
LFQCGTILFEERRPRAASTMPALHPARANHQYGRTKDDAPEAFAAAAIAAHASRREHSDRGDESRNEKRRAKIGYDPGASALSGRAVNCSRGR